MVQRHNIDTEITSDLLLKTILQESAGILRIQQLQRVKNAAASERMDRVKLGTDVPWQTKEAHHGTE